MTTFEHTIEILAPVDHVFSYEADPEHWHRSMPSLTDIEVIEETDNGFRLTGTWRMLGMGMPVTMEYTVMEPYTHAVATFHSDGMRGDVHYHYEETRAGTRVVQKANYEFGDSIYDRVLEPIAKEYNRRQFRNSLKTTKDIIESEAVVSA